MKTIKRVAVLGAGVMGSAIAAHLANSGLNVLLLDLPAQKLNGDDAAKIGLQRALKAKQSPHPSTDRSTPNRLKPATLKMTHSNSDPATGLLRR